MLGRTRAIHFVGVGGSGMSGIAELLANLGYDVSGSDAKRSDVTDRLVTLGVRIATGHDAAHVGAADVVVVSSAIGADNPEVVAARAKHVPVIPRAEMLAELMRLRYGIAVAGAHGKTTTTSMVALVLDRAGLDPTAVIGGRLSAFGSNARLGRGDYMVVEADESDRSFLKLTPSIGVITNIDREHMESYGTWEHLQQAFVDFANKVPFYGAVIACADDPALRELLPRLTRRVTTYGLGGEADLVARDMQLEAFGSTCTVTQRQAEFRDAQHWPALSEPRRPSTMRTMPARRLKIFFDGGCRPNPGKIEVAVVARGATCFFDDVGHGTSSDAEWTALRLAVQVAHSLGEPDFDLIGDCANVIAQANGLSKCRSDAALAHRASFHEAAASGPPKRLRWTPRNQNLAGIALARRRAFELWIGR